MPSFPVLNITNFARRASLPTTVQFLCKTLCVLRIHNFSNVWTEKQLAAQEVGAGWVVPLEHNIFIILRLCNHSGPTTAVQLPSGGYTSADSPQLDVLFG